MNNKINLITKYGTVEVGVNDGENIYVGVGDAKNVDGKEFAVRGVSIQGSMYYKLIDGVWKLEKRFNTGSVYLSRRDRYKNDDLTSPQLRDVLLAVDEAVNIWAITPEGIEFIKAGAFKAKLEAMDSLKEKIAKLNREMVGLDNELDDKFEALTMDERGRYNRETKYPVIL